MRKNRRKNSYKSLLVLLLLGISIGFALLNSNLQIVGHSGINKNTWDIHWDDESIQVTSGSVTTIAPVVTDNEKKNISFTTTLSLPGDFYEFTVDAVNTGTIDGMISIDALTPVITDNEGESLTLPDYIHYSVTYVDGIDITKKQLLAKRVDENTPTREKIKVRIEYDREAKQLPGSDIVAKIGTEVPYEPADEEAEEREKAADKCTITLNPNEGVVSPTTIKESKNKKIGILPIPTKTGKVFIGWYTALTEGVKVDEDYIIDEDKTLYAHWADPVATFDTGSSVNTKMKALANSNNITTFAKYSSTPDITSFTSDNIISANNSVLPIYAWYDNGTIYWWSQTNTNYLNSNSSYLFSSLSSIESIDISGLNTSEVTDMDAMFNGCSELTSINLSGLDTSNVTSMVDMFSNCSKLTSIDLSGLDTSHVTSMSSMFHYDTALTSINLSGLNTTNLENMDYMFESCESLVSIDLSDFDVSNVISFDSLFEECYSLNDVDLSGWNFNINALYVGELFDACYNLKSITLTNAKLASDSSGLFAYLSSLEEIIGLNTIDISVVTDMSNMFSDCSSLVSIDISGWDMSNVTSIYHMFGGCSNLTSLTLTNIKLPSDSSELFAYLSSLEEIIGLNTIDTSNVTNMNNMFEECSSLTSLNLSSWNMLNVENIACMFINCTSLETINLSGWNTSNITNFSYVFCRCSSLTSLDLSSWNTSSVTDMSNMFFECSSLVNVNLSGWDVEDVTLDDMFDDCYELISLNISGWNIAHTDIKRFLAEYNQIKSLNVTNMVFPSYSSGLFAYFYDLEEIIGIETVDTSNVTDMSSMFDECSSLTSLDLSGWDVSNVEDMNGMFHDCTILTTLDLSGWNTSNVGNMCSMFYSCSALETIYVGSNWSIDGDSSDNMFDDCTSLVGGNGTTYEYGHTDGEYARIDTASTPGYFTYKAPPINNTGSFLRRLFNRIKK